ncbi:DNA repair exonuclease [Bacillus spongiae]|uniref:DNA repair exonuclease n=1 Tax=Bacillus spongiae TaxID=2683610 RepID=A0ABU8HBC6_9BACI
MSSIRFIHTADLHLDSPFIGLNSLPKEVFQKIYNSTFRSFERIIEKAIDLEVDFVIISGDLYDGEDRSIKAQARLQKQLQRLHKASIPVFIIHGNHDHLGGRWHDLPLPNNVHIFKEQVEGVTIQTKNHNTVHLYGFSYRERHVFERKIAEYPIIRQKSDYHIGILHGSEGSVENHHEPYAPFTITDLIKKGMDYWALGHIHKTQTLSMEPAIVYPGNIQGRHRKEQGEKGCYEVTLSKEEVSLDFIATQEVVWIKEQVSLNEGSIFADFFSQLQHIKKKYRALYCGTLLEIEVVGDYPKSIADAIQSGELIQSLQDGEEFEERFVWTYSLYLQKNTEKVGNSLLFSELSSTIEKWGAVEWEETISALYFHPQANRYLDDKHCNDRDLLRQKTLSLLEATLNTKEE